MWKPLVIFFTRLSRDGKTALSYTVGKYTCTPTHVHTHNALKLHRAGAEIKGLLGLKRGPKCGILLMDSTQPANSVG